MKHFRIWYKEKTGKDIPLDIFLIYYFLEHGIPANVICTECLKTICVIDCFIDEKEKVYCHSCAKES